MRQGCLVKICGMRDPANVLEVAACLPDYMGFIFYAGSKRYVGANFNPDVTRGLPEEIKPIGVFVDASLKEIRETAKLFGLRAVQLHGQESPDLCAEASAGGLEVIKAFPIETGFDAHTLDLYADSCAYYLFDNVTAGSGFTFDWRILADVGSFHPFFLSGGLGLDNLASAREQYGTKENFVAVDLNSKLETAPGIKDPVKVKLAIEEVRKWESK